MILFSVLTSYKCMPCINGKKSQETIRKESQEKMGSTMSFVWCLIAIALAAMPTTATASTTHTVGGDQGWRIPKDNPSFYARWAANRTFIVGDKLGNKPLNPSPMFVFVFLSCCSFLRSICLQLFRTRGHNYTTNRTYPNYVKIALETLRWNSKYISNSIIQLL